MIRRLLHRKLRLHAWRYRNPYDRTCLVCRRHEVLHEYQPFGPRSVLRWDIFDEGNAAAAPCGRQEARA